MKGPESVRPSWASAGIADARAFRVGNSSLVHEPTHYMPNLVRGRCGVVAKIVETDEPRASWADSLPTCPTCKGRNT